MLDYSIVIPAYNEESNITTSLTQVISFMNGYADSYEILVVDDGSEDKTISAVENYIKAHPDIDPAVSTNTSVVRLIKNPHKGKGYTVRTGMLASKGNFVLFTDADMATPISELKRLMVWIQEHDYDMVIASREGSGAVRKNEPFIRHLMGRVFNFVTRIVVKGIKDTQCGFKVMKNNVAKDVFSRMILFGDNVPDTTKPRVSAFDLEMLIIAFRRGYKVKEVPVSWTYAPTTRVSALRDSLSMLQDVLIIKFNDLSGKYSSQNSS